MGTAFTSTRIADLVALLTKYRDAYYNGTPLVSDAVYDVLEDELRDRDPGNSLFKTIGAAPGENGWPKYRHKVPMNSLNKVTNDAEMRAWFNECLAQSSDRMFLVSEKMDGISISLCYERGSLIHAVTRGKDGEEGEDILRNVLLMKGVPHHILGFTGHVRAEVVCLRSDFKEHFEPKGYENPRNTASGICKRQSDPEACKHLTVVAYEWLRDERSLETKWLEIEALKNVGFSVPNRSLHGPFGSADSIHVVYQEYIDSTRASLDYDIDGLVIYVNNNAERERMGDKDHCPRGAVAYKFPSDAKRTTLNNIRWQVGNSGRVTPVAEFDSVVLAGANVKQASLYNVAYITKIAQAGAERNWLAKGDEILVARAGDVIPRVEALLTPIEKLLPELNVAFLPTPTHCPCCSEKLVMQGEYLVCMNTLNCEAQTAGAIKRWLVKTNVLEWGDAVIDALCERGLVHEPADLYALTYETLASVNLGGRIVGGSAMKMIDNLYAKMELPLDLIVGSLGIPLWGRSMCAVLVKHGFDTVEKLSDASVNNLAGLPGVGLVKAQAFVDGFEVVLPKLFKLIEAGVSVKPQTEGVLKGKAVCMTGFRDAKMEVAIADQGGSVKSSVSKTLSYLVASNPESTSGKAQQAREYQQKGLDIKIVGVEEMWEILGGRQ